MSKLNSQMHPLLTSTVLNVLFSKNIRSVTNFIEADTKHVAEITNVQYKDIVDVRRYLIKKYSAVSRNGFTYYNDFIAKSTLLPTGIKSLDIMLQGGLLTGNIYEICGLPGSGKTQITLTVAMNVTKNSNLKIFYIDTKRDFSGKKLKSMLDTLTTEETTMRNILSKISVKQISTPCDLINTLYELKNLLHASKTKIRLIIIDSLPPLFYSISDFSRSYDLISATVNIMHVLMKEYHTTIVVTNIVTLWYETYDAIEKIGLGKYWCAVPNTRLMVKNTGNSDCIVTVIRSNRLLVGSECNMKITEAGVV